MKLISSVEATSTLDPAFESHNCEIDPDGLAAVIASLTNLYPDAKLAVLREYVANALDAHSEAGTQQPVEVTLPSLLDPNVTITDHGVGLSRDDIVNVYGRYGASTKRGRNNQIGAFGLGAKTGYTVSSQFRVRAVKAGWASVVLFHLNAAGAPAYTIVDHSPSAESNGVQVTIPAAVDGLSATWQRAAETVLSTMPEGAVLLDGKPVDTVLTDQSQIAPGAWLGGRSGPKIDVLMGSLRYSVPESTVHALMSKLNLPRFYINLLVEVPLGAVDIAPSRETVRDTPRTVAAVGDAVGTAVERFRQRWAAEIEGRVASDVALLHARWSKRYGGGLFRQLADNGMAKLVGGARANVPTRIPGSSKRQELGWDSVAADHVVLAAADEDRGKVDYWLPRSDWSERTVTVVPARSGAVGWFSWGGEGSLLPVITLDEVIASAKAKRSSAPTTPKKERTVTPVTYYVHRESHPVQPLPVDQIVALPSRGALTVSRGGHMGDAARFLKDAGWHVVQVTPRQEKRARALLGLPLVDIAAERAATEILAGLDMQRLAEHERVDVERLKDAVRRAEKHVYDNAARILQAWLDVVDFPVSKLQERAARFVKLPKASVRNRLPIILTHEISSLLWGSAMPLLNLVPFESVAPIQKENH